MSYTVANYFNQLPFKPLEEYGEISDKLGEGAYGIVYKYKKGDGTEYAVKRMSSPDGDLPLATIRELSVATLLNHPNIAKIVDVNINKKGTTRMVMELAESDFDSYLEENKDLKPEQIKRFFYQLVKGLEYMHSLATWHRDIKPENILVFPNDTLKITDFGLARFGALPSNLYTVPVATLWYRSPDILLGSKSYGPGVDVWSLGLILGEMGYGEYIITGDNERETLKEIVEKIGGTTKAQWPGISGMTEFDFIRKINEEHPTGSIFSSKRLNKKLGTDGMDLLKRMLTPNPSKRIDIKEAADHPYFDSVRGEFNYPSIPDMVCGDQRVLKDVPAPQTQYKNQINDQMIQKLMHWLNTVTFEHMLKPASLYRARSFLDQYLKATDSKISQKNLQLLGIVALMIAAKIEDLYPPEVEDYIDLSDHRYSQEQLLNMEREIVKVLRFQLAYPIISEYISYYNEGLAKSVMKNANILGKALMVSPTIPNNYQAHDIAKGLVYIANNKESAICLGGVDTNLVDRIIAEIKGLKKIYLVLIGHPTENKMLGEILESWTSVPVSSPSTRSEPPQTIYQESPKLSGERLTKRVMIRFDGASDEDIDRMDVTNFLTDYIMFQALGYVNNIHSPLPRKIEKQLVDYFGFVPSAGRDGIYIRGKKELQRITYELGKLTVETNATIHFNYVLPELVPTFKQFLEIKLVDGTKYGNSKLSGALYNI